MTIGERIILIRKENGLSQDAFGTMINVSRQSISKWEANISIPEVDKLIEISKKFNVSIEWLIGIKENRNNQNDFNEEQLNKIEQIIQKHASMKPKRDISNLIISGSLAFFTVACLIFGGFVIYRTFNVLSYNVHDILYQMSELRNTIEKQNDKFESIESMLSEYKDIIIEEIKFEQYDLQEETAHILIKVRPKEYQKNTKIILEVNNGISTITEIAKEIDNHIFYADIKVKLSDEIEIFGKVINSNSEKQSSLIKFENKLTNSYYIPEKNYEADFVSDSQYKVFYVTNEVYTLDEIQPLEVKEVETYIFLNDEFYKVQAAEIRYDEQLEMYEYYTEIHFEEDKNFTLEMIQVLTDSHERTYVIEGQYIQKTKNADNETSVYYDRFYQADKTFNWQKYK